MGLHGATFVAPLPGTPPVGMSATDGRLVMGGLFGTTPQLVAGGGISQSGSNMQFTVAQSVFQLSDVTNAAATAFLPTDSTVLTPAVGPGTGSRIDLICIPFKNYENGDASSQSQPILVAGTAGTPGVAPAVPSGSYKYAQITVGTGVTTASACTVVTFGNTTFAPPDLQSPTLALLQTVTGKASQHATVYADGANNGDYAWSSTTWVPAQPTVTRDWITYAPVASSTTLKTVALPAVPYASVVEIRFDGLLADGTGSAHAARVVFTASAGTLQLAHSQPDYVPANQVVTHVVVGLLTIPANTAVTLTAATATATATTYYEGVIKTVRTAS